MKYVLTDSEIVNKIGVICNDWYNKIKFTRSDNNGYGQT